MLSFDLSGKVAIVTGASQGLGVEFAMALAQFGADVAVMARRAELLETVAGDIRAATGRDILPVRCDITDEDSIRAAVNTVLEYYGKIDILVNNAGVIERNRPGDQTMEQWNRVMDANLTGPFFMAQEVYNRWMKAHGGKVVNISSVGGVRASAASPGYAISKAAMIHMTRCMAVAWAAEGICVNCISPGQTTFGMGAEAPKESVATYAAKIPQQRLGGQDDITGALIYLASDACRYTQGQNIVCDGGLTLPL